MNKVTKIVIVIVLIAVISIVFALKQKDKTSVSESVAMLNSNLQTASEIKPQNTANPEVSVTSAVKLPQLVDLGADKCIPCKMMKPILDELKREYKDSFEVIFIDVWENPSQAKKYNIRVIPVQIFFDAAGKELFRHEGFFSKEDILAKWEEFEVTFEKGTNNATN